MLYRLTLIIERPTKMSIKICDSVHIVAPAPKLPVPVFEFHAAPFLVDHQAALPFQKTQFSRVYARNFPAPLFLQWTTLPPSWCSNKKKEPVRASHLASDGLPRYSITCSTAIPFAATAVPARVPVGL